MEDSTRQQLVRITAPTAGIVVRLAAAGEVAGPGRPVAVLEVMKLEQNVCGTVPLQVAPLHVKAGDAVSEGDPLLTGLVFAAGEEEV